ncbi:hypothetical protein Tco_0139177 [Tanacetum coccineum]
MAVSLSSSKLPFHVLQPVSLPLSLGQSLSILVLELVLRVEIVWDQSIKLNWRSGLEGLLPPQKFRILGNSTFLSLLLSKLGVTASDQQYHQRKDVRNLLLELSFKFDSSLPKEHDYLTQAGQIGKFHVLALSWKYFV